ncbi:hypothetical protein [Leptolyngbya iicbica]|uniref:Uncharacterized protein n=2 Tax=Cyanophyceae TaxID=3028117 RepID=A0A4Q7EI85_9CYAN|nr:hypothetical protein [Leptolyngbya sp. LK]RZM82857.1 hypothetical protein DYY88_06550 [Leptolyngbya sp. LK]
MDWTRLVVQILIALGCAGLATVLIPRRIPGKIFGLIVIGFAGVWLGEWVIKYLETTYSLPIPDFVTWDIQGVPILPAVLGSAVILFVVTAFLSWGRYQR